MNIKESTALEFKALVKQLAEVAFANHGEVRDIVFGDDPDDLWADIYLNFGPTRPFMVSVGENIEGKIGLGEDYLLPATREGAFTALFLDTLGNVSIG